MSWTQKALRTAGRLAKATIDPDQWRGMSTTVEYDDGGQPMWSGGSGYVSLGSNLKVYRTQPAVRQVIEFIAEAVATVPIKTYQRVSDDDRRFLADDPAQQLMDEPGTDYTPYDFKVDYVTDLELFDKAAYRIKEAEGVLALERLFPDAVTLSIDGTTFTVRRGDGTFYTLRRDEVLYQHGYGSRHGISPIETLKSVLSEDKAAAEYREGLYKNGMRNAGVIERPADAPDFSDKARTRFLEQLESRFTGSSNTGRPLLLEEGMTWKSDQISMRNDEYIAGRQLTLKSVANFYHIQPALLGLEPAAYASISAYNSQLYQGTLASRLESITQRFAKDLMSREDRRGGKYFEFHLESKLRGSFAEQAAVAQMALGGSAWMTVPEFRARMELPKLDDDELAELTGAGSGAETPGPAPTGAAETDQPAPSEDAGAIDVPKSGRKAKDRAALRRRAGYVEDLEKVLADTFERVARQAKALAVPGKGAAFSKARWESEIAKDLRPVQERIVLTEGARKATQLGGEFDPALVQHYLDAGAKNVGRNVALAAEDAVERHADATDDTALKTALAAIATRVAVGQATHLMSFAREEAGKQTGASKKTWNVTSSNSRHPELDGETAKLGAEFSNGLAYPGDTSGDADETAGCTCILDIS